MEISLKRIWPNIYIYMIMIMIIKPCTKWWWISGYVCSISICAYTTAAYLYIESQMFSACTRIFFCSSPIHHRSRYDFAHTIYLYTCVHGQIHRLEHYALISIKTYGFKYFRERAHYYLHFVWTNHLFVHSCFEQTGRFGGGIHTSYFLFAFRTFRLNDEIKRWRY